MDTITVVGMSAFSCLLLLVLLLQIRKLASLTGKAIDLSLVLTRIDWLQTLREQADRAAREDSARGRQEQLAQFQALRTDILNSMAGMGDSVANKLDGFSRINDQRMESLRTAMDQRLDSFTVETARKVDGLT
jgi:hypothetical protein